MINIWQLCPGDVIHRCNVGTMDEDVPLMVLGCWMGSIDKWHMGSAVSEPCVHVYGVYMLASGFIHLKEIVIDVLSAHEYDWVISHTPQRTMPTWL